MNDQRAAEGLMTSFGLGFLAFALLCLITAITTVSPWPAIAGLAASWASYVGFKSAWLERKANRQR